MARVTAHGSYKIKKSPPIFSPQIKPEARVIRKAAANVDSNPCISGFAKFEIPQ